MSDDDADCDDDDDDNDDDDDDDDDDNDNDDDDDYHDGDDNHSDNDDNDDDNDDDDDDDGDGDDDDKRFCKTGGFFFNENLSGTTFPIHYRSIIIQKDNVLLYYNRTKWQLAKNNQLNGTNFITTTVPFLSL